MSHPALRRLARMAVCLAAAAMICSPALARRKPRTVPVTSLPQWLQQACARPTPETDRNAVWLHDEQLIEPLAAGGVRITVRAAVRILAPSALDDWSEPAFAYKADDQILLVRGWTISPAQRARVFGKKKGEIADQPYNESFVLHTDARIRSLNLQGITVGSVAAWEYTHVVAIDRGARHCALGSSSLPSLFSSCRLEVPEGWQWSHKLENEEDFSFDQTESGFSFRGENLQPLATAEFRPPVYELLPSVWMRWFSPDGKRGFRNWNDIAAWSTALSAPVLTDVGEAGEVSQRLTPETPEQIEQAISRAFEFASRDVRYVAIMVGIGGYQPHSPASVCKNRFGDCKDKAYLLRAIVEGWGLKSYPVLVRTSDLGEVDEDVPTPGQFNHCIAAIALPEGVGDRLWPVARVEGLGRLLFLDATANQAGAWTLPTGDQGTLALVVATDEGHLVRLPSQPPEAAHATRRLVASLDVSGQLTEAILTERWNGTRAAGIRSFYKSKTQAEIDAERLELLQYRFPNAQITGFVTSGVDTPGAAVEETTRFTGARGSQKAGNLLILKPLRLGLGVIESALPPPPRQWPLEVGNPRKETVILELDLPKGWQPEALPEPQKISTQELVAESQWSFAKGRLRFERSVSLLVSSVPPERYELFWQSVRTLAAIDRAGVVLVQ